MPQWYGALRLTGKWETRRTTEARKCRPSHPLLNLPAYAKTREYQKYLRLIFPSLPLARGG